MKNVFLMSLLVAGSLHFAHAQTTTTAPTRELGVRFDGLNFGGNNSFGLIYKKQKAENRYHRWRAAFANISTSSSTNQDSDAQFGAGLFFGLEKRKTLNERFTFNHGWEFGGSLAAQFAENNNRTSLGISAGYVLGLQYNPNNRFFINLETIPGVNFRVSNSTAGTGTTDVFANVGFTSAATLTLGFRF